MSNQKSLVSILIPVYNTSKYLGRCIESALKQTYQYLEVIAVNDGSTDDSGDILGRYGASDSRLRVLSQPNRGLAHTRNVLLGCANGEYVLNLDSDDYLDYRCVELLIKSIESEGSDIAICDVIKEFSHRDLVVREPYRQTIDDLWEFLHVFITENALNSIWNKLIRRSIYEKNSIRAYEGIELGEDSATLLRLVAHAKRISHVAVPLYHYNCMSSGMSQIVRRDLRHYVDGLMRVETYYAELGLSTAVFPWLRLKLCYAPLAKLGLREARRKGYGDYDFVAAKFLSEFWTLVAGKMFWELKAKFIVFAIGYFFYLHTFARWILRRSR